MTTTLTVGEPSTRTRRDRRRTAPRKTLQGWPLLGAQALVIAALIGLWQAASASGVIDPDYLPPPSDVFGWLREEFVDGTIYKHLWATTLGMVLAFTIGSGSGFLVGVILGRFAQVASVVSPIISFCNAIPRVALAPLFVLYLGISVWSKVAVGVSVVFFVLLINTLAGLRAADPDLVRMAEHLRFPQRKIFLKVIFPSAVPAIFAGLKLAAVYSLLGVVVGEMVASVAGMGQLIVYNSNTFNLAGVYGSLVVLAVLGTILSTLMNLLEGRLLAWQQYAHR